MRPRRRVSRALQGLGRLDAAELRAAFASLLAVHPHLSPDVERITRALSPRRPKSDSGDDGTTARIEEIARELEAELISLDVLDLTSPRADPWNRRSTSEETWERLHQAVAPTVEAMQHLVDLGRTDAGLEVLQAVLLALYRVETEGRSGELLEGAPDFPGETAAWAWEVWQKATRGRVPLPPAFARQHLPEWPWLRKDPKTSSDSTRGRSRRQR